jgi:hypothetical protein
LYTFRRELLKREKEERKRKEDDSGGFGFAIPLLRKNAQIHGCPFYGRVMF